MTDFIVFLEDVIDREKFSVISAIASIVPITIFFLMMMMWRRRGTQEEKSAWWGYKHIESKRWSNFHRSKQAFGTSP